jgi:hypothetical protein
MRANISATMHIVSTMELLTPSAVGKIGNTVFPTNDVLADLRVMPAKGINGCFLRIHFEGVMVVYMNSCKTFTPTKFFVQAVVLTRSPSAEQPSAIIADRSALENTLGQKCIAGSLSFSLK